MSEPIEMDSLCKQALSLLPQAKVIEIAQPKLTLVRSDETVPGRVPVIYDPCIYFVLQGSKSALLGDKEYIYDAMNYLVLSVPLPLQCKVLQASPDKPYLALKISIDTQLLTELVQESKPRTDSALAVQPGLFVSKLVPQMKSSLSRLLDAIGDKERANILGTLTIKELLFYVLQGPQGAQLRAFAYRDRQNFQIAKAIAYIQENFAHSIEVRELAEQANMSSSSFHTYFKSITSSTPIQYIKAIRLHAARRNMVHDNQSASVAAFNVGYASPSQFSREYRRLFGASPSVDVRVQIMRLQVTNPT